MLDVIRPGDPRYADLRHVYTATGAPAAATAVDRRGGGGTGSWPRG